MPSETVNALRKQLREKFPAAHRKQGGEPEHSPSPEAPAASFPLALRNFPRGAISEISPSHPACGISLLVAALVSEEPEHGRDTPLVLVDARDGFDPASFTPEECARLLWLRCRETQDAFKAADLLLRDGNLPSVLLDLSSLPSRELRRIPLSSWHRLRQLAETSDVSLIALTPVPLVPGATLRLQLTRSLSLTSLLLPRSEAIDSLHLETTRALHQSRTA
ncbi:hypothetical protein HAHE_38220 [Haloferula helveola]|uniref:Recombinase A n=1 Tax=Haloferula helveola TaxID=490095 RepID=A0ABN6HBU2_9BACT|nr:hypothetical protein HAHE_38220 [Haloferula helveola]